MKSKAQIIKGILCTKRYAAIAAGGGGAMGAAYYILTMSMLVQHAGSGAMAAESHAHIAASVLLTAAVSVLAGVNFALVAFRIKRARMMTMMSTAAAASTEASTSEPGKKKSASQATPVLGGIFAAFTPGCPACTAPLAAILGAVGGLSVFPMQGLELKILSAGVLAFSIWWVARGLQKNSCCQIG